MPNDDLYFTFDLGENDSIEADFDLEENNDLDANFNIYAAGTTWGSISGNIINQPDLYSNLTGLQSQITVNNNAITEINNTIATFGDIVSYNASDFATAAQGLLAESALQPNDDISELNNDAGYITSADLPTVDQTFDGTSTNAQSGIAIQGELTNYVPKEYLNTKIDISSSGLTIADAENQTKGSILVISKAEGASLGYLDATDMSNIIANTISANANGILLQSMNTNGLSAVTLTSVNNNLAINGTEVQEKLVSGTSIKTLNNISLLGSGDITIADLTTIAQINALNSGATSTNIGQITINQTNIADIRTLIPAQATSTNQLADKNFVNSSISTNTANFIGTFNSVAELEAYSGTLTNNDYAFVATTDTAGNTLYDRYKYNADTQQWIFEFELNNSSFTAAQWNSINSGITGGDVTLIQTALQPNDNISELTNDAGYITAASLPTVNNGTLDIQVNGTSVGTFTANQSGNTTANIVVPDSATWGNITGTLSNQTDLQNALNSKYDASNPNGYITSDDLPTNYVTTDTAQDISGKKTFLGEKAIYFKQQATTNKLGFTLYNPSNVELGALEYRPNTISGSALLNLNCPQTTGDYVGFRYWGTPAVNIIAPKVATAGNYFMATHITNGTLTVTANNQGTVDISSLLPDVSNFVTNTSLSTTLQDYVLSSDLSTTLNDYQPLLESGTNIKTINNQSLLGSGNINTLGLTYESTTETLKFA